MYSETPEFRLENLGITLPKPGFAVGFYRPWIRSGTSVYISGQLPMVDGKIPNKFQGLVGKKVDLTNAREAAKVCVINIMSQLKAACGGDLNKIEKIIKIQGFVACDSEFTLQPKVLDAASELLVEILQDSGRHTRIAVGVSSLPLGVCVEIDAQAEIKI